MSWLFGSEGAADGCKTVSVLWFFSSTDCTANVVPPRSPPPPTHTTIIVRPKPPPPNYGTTMVRFTVGSHHMISMGGSIPAVALFDEFGQRIAQVQSKHKTSIPGSFTDVAVMNKKEYTNVRPTYLLLQGGEKEICITSIGMTFPDGSHQVFTGSDLDACNRNGTIRLHTSESRTFITPSQVQPLCFWLTGTDRLADTAQRVSFHLPDFIWSNTKRREAYKENMERVCRQTPRFYQQSNQNGNVDLDFPIPIFNPMIEYDPQTGFDKDPDHVLKWNWATSENAKQDLSDFRYRNWPAKSGQSKRFAQMKLNNTSIENLPAYKDLVKDVVKFVEDESEKDEEHVRIEAPRLIISEGQVSAQKQCLMAVWDNTDYVSLSEKIYCDMQSRSMFQFCEEKLQNSCWNAAENRLQGMESVNDKLPLETEIIRRSWNASATEMGTDTLGSLWAATGPLYQYTYQNVTLLP